jgi:cobalt-zinc-cadmium efflux system membrane fusion protein
VHKPSPRNRAVALLLIAPLAALAALGALGALGALVQGCNKHIVAVAESPEAPAGEVWLTSGQGQGMKLKVETVSEQMVDDTIISSGRIAFDDTRVAHVFSPVTGRVTNITAILGQRVKKSEPLVSLESPDVGVASSDLGKAQADVIAAEHDLARQKELLDAHATSQHDYEQSEDAYRKAKAELDRARQKVSLLHGGFDSVSQTYTVRAPIEGEVVARNVAPGVEIQGQYGGGQAVELFTIGELDRVWVVADVYEMDLGRIKLGSKVNVKVIAQPNRVFSGKVDWLSRVLDPQTRTARVRCTFDNADRALLPEMYATVEITVDEHKALALPRSAIVRLGEQTVVFVDKGASPDGRVRYVRTPVTVDEQEGAQLVPVQHGLEKGMRVVTEGGVVLSGNL